MNTKEGALVSAVMLYAMRCVVEGDTLALQHMQFGKKEIDALRELSLHDLYRAESFKAHCLKISLNRQVFWPLMAALKREQKTEAALSELIEQDAPFDMMQVLFGLSNREYSTRRRHLPASLGQGRPALPEPDKEEALFDVWQTKVRERESVELPAQDYVDMHVQTGISHRAIWQLTRLWSDEEVEFS